MNCTVHQTQPSVGPCAICGSPYCTECVRLATESRVCSACQYQSITRWNETRLSETRHLNPVNAGWLAVIPFMGAIYNGTYRRALWQAIAFFSIPLLFAGQDEPMRATAMLLFYVFTIVDAYRTARALRTGAQEPESAGFWEQKWGKFLKGAGLIVLGILFLLHNLNVDVWIILRFWPILLIAVGGWIVWQWFTTGRTEEPVAAPYRPVLRKKDDHAADAPAAPSREV